MTDEARKLFRLNWRFFLLRKFQKLMVEGFTLDDKMIPFGVPVDRIEMLVVEDFEELAHERLNLAFGKSFLLFGQINKIECHYTFLRAALDPLGALFVRAFLPVPLALRTGFFFLGFSENSESESSPRFLVFL